MPSATRLKPPLDAVRGDVGAAGLTPRWWARCWATNSNDTCARLRGELALRVAALEDGTRARRGRPRPRRRRATGVDRGGIGVQVRGAPRRRRRSRPVRRCARSRVELPVEVRVGTSRTSLRAHQVDRRDAASGGWPSTAPPSRAAARRSGPVGSSIRSWMCPPTRRRSRSTGRRRTARAPCVLGHRDDARPRRRTTSLPAAPSTSAARRPARPAPTTTTRMCEVSRRRRAWPRSATTSRRTSSSRTPRTRARTS